jgi:hypothetical protein
MENRLVRLGFRAGLWLAAIGVAWSAVPSSLAQASLVSAPDPARPARPRILPDRLPDKPSIAPSFAIPVEPLGFSSPGPIYLGQRNTIVSLDFLGENRLLFTFRVPGLMRREAGESDERQIRAVTVTLPEGKVESEALWTVHDRERYLWMLHDGHFLFRDREDLELGDASLELKPFLRFPGPLLWLQMDPTQQFMVTDSREADPAAGKPADTKHPGDHAQLVTTPPTASATMAVNGEQQDAQSQLVVRILRRDSGKVMLVSHARTPVRLPINADGYLESLRGKGAQWIVNLNYFSGGSTILGRVDSTCSPLFDFVSQREVLLTGCTPNGAFRLIAMATDGRRLWEAQTSNESIWPLVVRAPDGSRLARESLAVTHPVSAYAPLDWGDIKGQLVQVFDAADGNLALETTASPVLDAGGNVALSLSGRRVAVLNAGAIQIFDLPAPVTLPEPIGNHSAN